MSAYDTFTASAVTPDEQAAATIAHRDQVTVTLAPGYFPRADAVQLERQLARLAKLLFVSRMREYHRARSRDFSQPVLKEAPPESREDHQYVDARARLHVTGGEGGPVEVAAVGMEQWRVSIDRDWLAGVDEAEFCRAASQAASELVRHQFEEILKLKRSVYAS